MNEIQTALFNMEQHQETSNDHYTPKWVFDLLNVEFDIAVASPPGGVPWIPAKKYFTQFDDGLTQNWEGFIWCNPPYSNVQPWVDKMKQHRNGIMLLPMVKSYWRLGVWNDADGICEPNEIDRIKFILLILSLHPDIIVLPTHTVWCGEDDSTTTGRDGGIE